MTTPVKVATTGDKVEERGQPPVSKPGAQGVGGVRTTVKKAENQDHRKKAKVSNGAATEADFPIGDGFSITEDEVKIVRGMVKFMNDKGMTGLLIPRNAKHIKAEGVKVEKLHPLNFLYSLATDKDSRAYLRTMETGTTVFYAKIKILWNSFLGYSAFSSEGLGRELIKFFGDSTFEASKPMLHLFCEAVGLDKAVMEPLAETAFREQKEVKEQGKDLLEYSGSCIWEAFIVQTFQER